MFEIKWIVSQEQWERARVRREQHSPGSSYDTSQSPLYQLLVGALDMKAGTTELYGDGGISVSVLDVAVFVARLLGETNPDSVCFDQLDDDRHIHFDFSTPCVRVTAEDSENVLEAPHTEVIASLTDFVTSVARAINRDAPRLFDWQSIAPLAQYR